MIGRTLDHYTILEPLGEGGMGQVYRARDERLRRDVAIKVIRASETPDPQSQARLLREARLASALNHPNICTIHAVGEHDGQTFLVMELVEGRPLSAELAARPGGLPAAEALGIGSQIAEALQHAHGRGVIHRDLKTSNVMLMPEGRVKVLDFGLARRMATETSITQGLSSRLTESGVLVGTVEYLPPEVLRGDAATAMGDIWALGIVLSELASGQVPFRGATSYEVTASILNAPPAELPAAVLPGLRAVIARCLEKDPAVRFQHAAEIRDALEALRIDPRAMPVQGARAPRRVPWLGVGAGAGAALVLAAAAILFGSGRGCPGPVGAIRSLAVLPMANLSGDPKQEYFADGMTDELITDLAGIGSLRVIARGSVMVYKGTRKTLRQIANELHVDGVVEGSVTQAGDRVRILARLSRGNTGVSLWSESYERNLRDVLELQSDVARAIAGKVKARLEPAEEKRLDRSQSVDPAVYQAYLKGRFAWNRYTLEGFEEAQRQFQSAIERDPAYAPAWAGMADAAYGMSSLYVAPDVAIKQARAAAEKALALDPNLAEAHTSLGIVRLVYDWNWAGAEQEFARALELKPSSADAHWWLGRSHLVHGRFDEALAEGRKALDLDPLSSWYDATQGWNLLLARRDSAAVAHLRAGLALHPDDYTYHVFLGLALQQSQDGAGAVQELEKAVSMDVNNDDLAQLAQVYATAGRVGDAKRVIERLRARAQSQFVPASAYLMAYNGLKDKGETLRWLEAALEDHSEPVLLLGVDPMYDWIRPDPRFQAALHRMGLAS
jgi:TolB-like protein/Tfp pilus assembly protein PilF